MHIVGLVIMLALCKNSWLYDQSYRRSSRGILLPTTLREIYRDLIVTKFGRSFTLTTCILNGLVYSFMLQLKCLISLS